MIAAADKAYADLGIYRLDHGHLSHSYHSGACLYFTFAFKHDGVDPIAQYDVVKSAIQQRSSTPAARCRTTTPSAPSTPRWLEQDISEPGVG